MRVCQEPGCGEPARRGEVYCALHLEQQFDARVAAAFIPNAAELMRRARKKGYITATSEYAGMKS